LSETQGDRRQLDNEQEARIALMDRFRSYLQYWGTILVGLAVAFFSLLQFKCELSSVGLFEIGVVLLVTGAAYAFLRIAVFGKLLEHAVRTETRQPVQDRMAFLHWLHEEILEEVRHEWHGFGQGLIWLGTWIGWILWTLFGTLVGLVLFYLMDLTRILVTCVR